ncbi:IS3 family transposase [Bacillus sp. RAR_GA_16]|uniref:IS3 family transposase n=1 Tax=Bacillus sp. RAR_GA_16 TaxID=2876774 RepID=UPI001CCCF5EF|nr:IS3 family transposase [Bacillus sp. RAR_GA_16]MCA0172580.1 IS3 family transposase [Bacillus sp. RAR_GA_16]MCA0173626.1 IS3 family transposase [Bacillus sp. RAR_GA_16]
MSNRLFTEVEMEQLEKNPNVLRVSQRTITYHPSFKQMAILEYQNGKFPSQIFEEHGFDVNMIGKDQPNRSLKRWRQTFEKYGKEGLEGERRGKGSPGRPPQRELSTEEKLKKAEARINYLEAENGIPKKARQTRKAGVEEEKIAPQEVYTLIERVIEKYSLKNMISYLCAFTGVSRSGYYAWLKCRTKREWKNTKDEQDVTLIRTIFQQEDEKVGALQIKMILENDYEVIMNHKKIRRLMRKFHLVTKIRRANPYKRMMKATQEHRTCPNLLNRQFKQEKPRLVFLTDITYIYYGKGQKAYLSCVKDSTTNEIVAHHVSTSLGMKMVYRTLEKLKLIEGGFHPEALIHSDQGFHYTHPYFQQKVREAGLQQSMSRKGNCWDNAPMESFFGHFKDRVNHKACRKLKELKKKVDHYIQRYNHQRYQWGLNKMTPVQYRGHLLAA